MTKKFFVFFFFFRVDCLASIAKKEGKEKGRKEYLSVY